MTGVLVGFVGKTAAQESPRGLAAEVWDAEVRHWGLLVGRDLDRYMEFYHRDYLGWPHFSDVPVRKATLRIIPMEVAEGDIISHELGRPAIQVFGGAAVTHYLVRLDVRRRDGTVARETVRYSRAWVKVDGDWIIMMESSAAVDRPLSEPR